MEISFIQYASLPNFLYLDQWRKINAVIFRSLEKAGKKEKNDQHEYK